MNPYTPQFYDSHRSGAKCSAQSTVPVVLQLVSPKSAIDVGCGVGTWLAVIRDHGVRDILGVDGEYVNRTQIEIPSECFLPHDLRQPLRLPRRFDLAMSLEVAEHLPPECAEIFVESLVRLAPVVLFSAAAPFQGGENHLNEQWPAYWAERFATHNYLPIDCLRRKLWACAEVDWWYAQNSFLYVEQGYLQAHSTLLREHLASPTALPLVHPKRYLEWVEWGIAQSKSRQ